MTNTTNNVPRELLERCCKRMYDMMQGDLHEELRAILSAPSPAGVDGLEVVGYVSRDDIKWQGDCTLRLKPYSDYTIPLCRLSDAQAIIDGLRGEVERLQMQLAACGVVALANTIESAGDARQMHPDYMSASCSDVADAVDREIALRTERDQQAQRIGELASHLEFAVTMLTVAGLAGNAQVEAMRAALSAGKENQDEHS